MNPAHAPDTPEQTEMLQRLERLPLSWVQGRLLLMGGLGYTFDAANNAILAFILPPVSRLFALGNAQTGLLGSSVLIGYLFGAFFAGTLGDLIGRKRVMMYALAVYCAGSLLGACAQSFGFLFFARIVAGVGTGAESAIVAPYLAEFIQSRYRGRYLGSLSGFFSFGFVLAAVLGYAIVPARQDGWRVVQVLTSLPILMLLWWRRALPESPRWLIARGRLSEAEQIVDALENHATRPAREPKGCTSIAPRADTSPSGSFRENLRALWSPQWVRSTTMLWALWISITFSYYGFFTWIPTLLVKRGLTVTKSFEYSIVIYIAQIPGYFSAALLSERLDRKWTIILYMLGGGAAAFLMANAREPKLITFFGFWLSFFMNGTYAGIYAYTPEVYPTAFRATGMGVASAFGRVGGILSPIIIGLSFARIGFAGVFVITTVVLVSGALIVGVMGIKTSGRTLEQISGGRA